MAITYSSQECKYLPSGRRKLSSWIKLVVGAEGYKVGDVNFVFCSPEYHLDINRRYLGHDYHTDVITFDYSDLPGASVVSGDILIDPRQVGEQSGDWNSSPEDEMHRVMVHGVLHLCGYGDKTTDEQHEMRSKENYYLDKLSEL